MLSKSCLLTAVFLSLYGLGRCKHLLPGSNTFGDIVTIQDTVLASCKGHFMCEIFPIGNSVGLTCLHARYVCDGIPNCPDGSDENPSECAGRHPGIVGRGPIDIDGTFDVGIGGAVDIGFEGPAGYEVIEIIEETHGNNELHNTHIHKNALDKQFSHPYHDRRDIMRARRFQQPVGPPTDVLYDGPEHFNRPERLPKPTDIFVPDKYIHEPGPRISRGFGRNTRPIGPPPDVLYDKPKGFNEPKGFENIIKEPRNKYYALPTSQSPGYKPNLKHHQISYSNHQENKEPVASQKHIEYNPKPTYYGHAHNTSPSSGKQIVFVPYSPNDPSPPKHHPPVKAIVVPPEQAQQHFVQQAPPLAIVQQAPSPYLQQAPPTAVVQQAPSPYLQQAPPTVVLQQAPQTVVPQAPPVQQIHQVVSRTPTFVQQVAPQMQVVPTVIHSSQPPVPRITTVMQQQAPPMVQRVIAVQQAQQARQPVIIQGNAIPRQMVILQNQPQVAVQPVLTPTLLAAPTALQIPQTINQLPVPVQAPQPPPLAPPMPPMPPMPLMPPIPPGLLAEMID